MISLNKIILSCGFGYLYYCFTKKQNKKINSHYFKNKNILITGASSGIGKNIANILSKFDCKLFLLARSFNDEISNNVYKYKCDCSDYLAVKEVISKIYSVTNFKIDIIVHSAGSGEWKFLNEMPIKEIDNCLKAPLQSSINITHTTLNNLINSNSGQIVFIQSPVVIQPWSSCTAYSISRWGMRGLSESLRADLYKTNIKISEIILGRTNSNYFITNKTADERFPLIGNIIRRINPNEAALAVLWCIQNKKEYYYYPFMMNIIIYLQYLCPSIVRYLTFKTSYYN